MKLVYCKYLELISNEISIYINPDVKMIINGWAQWTFDTFSAYKRVSQKSNWALFQMQKTFIFTCDQDPQDLFSQKQSILWKVSLILI